MAIEVFWTWYGTIIAAFFILGLGLVIVTGGDALTGAIVSSIGVALAVLGGSVYQSIVGMRRRSRS